MKQRVLKYAINNHGQSKINLPVAATICKVAYQGDCLCIWAVMPLHPALNEFRTFTVFGTGHEFGDDAHDIVHCHLETVFEGQFVWHIFEVFGNE